MKDCEDLIKDERYRNWVKGALGIQQTSKAVCEYVERKFSMYLLRRATLNKPNIQSFLTDDEYSHFRDVSTSMLRYNLRQNVKLKKGKWKCHCQNTWEKLLCLHKSHANIHLNNMDDTRNLSHEWAIAKIFMPKGNKKNQGPDDTDPSAIFTVMNMCDLFTNTIRAGNIKGVIKARNKIFHSPDSLVENSDLETYFTHMENLVSDALNDEDNDKDLKRSIEENLKRIVEFGESEMTVTLLEDAMKIKRTAVYYDFEQYVSDIDLDQLHKLLQFAEKVGWDLEKIRENLRIKEQEKQYDTRICKIGKTPQTTIRDIQQDIKAKDEEIQNLEGRLKEKFEEYGKLQENIAYKEAKILGLEERLNEGIKENGELQEEISKNKATISELLQQQHNLERQLNEQKSDFKDVSKNRDDILQQLECLQHKKEPQRCEIDSLKWEIAAVAFGLALIYLIYLSL